MVPVRFGTNLWWYSSIRAKATTSAAEIKNQRCLTVGRGEVRNARAAKNPRIAYSVKCATFRVMKWMVASVSILVFGNSQSTSGPMMRDVLLAEKLAEEA